MPRSKFKEYQRNMEKAINRFVDSHDKFVVNEYNKAINKLKKEAEKMYDSFIDQFYLYRTKSYIRHGQTRPGTGNGINLYRGQHIRVETKTFQGFRINKLIIDFNGSDMESKRYKYDSADQVLDYVMSGIRFTHEFENGKWEMTWEGNYDGEYYSSLNKNMKQAFDDFMMKKSSMVNDIIGDKIDIKKKELMKNLRETWNRNINGMISSIRGR